MKLYENISKRQFYILMFALIIWLGFSIFTFIYFKNECSMAKESPLSYAAKKHNIDTCSCFIGEGEMLFFNQTRVWIERSSMNPISKMNVSAEIEKFEEGN